MGLSSAAPGCTRLYLALPMSAIIYLTTSKDCHILLTGLNTSVRVAQSVGIGGLDPSIAKDLSFSFSFRYFIEQKSKRIELTLTSSVSRALSHRKTMIFHDQGVIRVITVEMFFMNMDSKVIFA